MKAKLTLAILAVLAVALTLPLAAGELSPSTREALLAALDDERRAQATYHAILDRFGDVMPFAHIVQAEGRHAAEVIVLLEAYGVPVPADPWPEREIEVPDTLQAACAAGVESEIANVALYDRWLETIDEPDIRTTFERLRMMSQERHLRAFTRCAEGGGGAGRQMMGRQGQGKGMGAGKAQCPHRGQQAAAGGDEGQAAAGCPCCPKCQGAGKTS